MSPLLVEGHGVDREVVDEPEIRGNRDYQGLRRPGRSLRLPIPSTKRRMTPGRGLWCDRWNRMTYLGAAVVSVITPPAQLGPSGAALPVALGASPASRSQARPAVECNERALGLLGRIPARYLLSPEIRYATMHLFEQESRNAPEPRGAARRAMNGGLRLPRREAQERERASWTVPPPPLHERLEPHRLAPGRPCCRCPAATVAELGAFRPHATRAPLRHAQ